MQSELVYKSTGLKGIAYTPERFEAMSGSVNEDYLQYIPGPIKDMVGAVSMQEGKLLRPKARKMLFEQILPLYESSERRKLQIEQELKTRRKEIAQVRIGKWHPGKDMNTTIRPAYSHVQQLLNDLAAINKLVEAAFSSTRDKATYNQFMEKRQQLQTV